MANMFIVHMMLHTPKSHQRLNDYFMQYTSSFRVTLEKSVSCLSLYTCLGKHKADST